MNYCPKMVKKNLISSYLRGWMEMPTTMRKDGMNANFPAILYSFKNCLKTADFKKKKKKKGAVLCISEYRCWKQERLGLFVLCAVWQWLVLVWKALCVGVVYHQFITQREERPSLSAVSTFLHRNRLVGRNLSLGHRSQDTCCKSGLQKSGSQLVNCLVFFVFFQRTTIQAGTSGTYRVKLYTRLNMTIMQLQEAIINIQAVQVFSYHLHL